MKSDYKKGGMKKFIIITLILALMIACSSCYGGLLTNGGVSNGSESNNISSSETTSEKTSVTLPSNVKFEINYVQSDEIQSSTVTEVVAKVRPSVLELYCIVGTSKSSGSGVIVSFDDSDDDGENDKALVVTCHHVIEDSESITAKSIYGKEYTAELIAADPVSDIALCWISKEENADFEGLTAASMMYESDKLLIGADVLAIGNPLGYLGGTVTKGIVSALNRDVTVEDRKMTLIQTDAAINGGNSGGGLFDAQTGALIGIVNAGYKSSAAQGLSFAIPCGTVKDVMDKLLDKGYIEGSFDFGATFEAKSFYVNSWSTTTYIVISEIDVYGTFSRGGLEAGDVILSVKVGDKSIDVSNYDSDTIEKLTNFLADSSFKIGDDVTVSYMRYNRSSRSYKKAVANFKIEQYIYGII